MVDSACVTGATKTDLPFRVCAPKRCANGSHAQLRPDYVQILWYSWLFPLEQMTVDFCLLRFGSYK
jgi:hypothetical protein